MGRITAGLGRGIPAGLGRGRCGMTAGLMRCDGGIGRLDIPAGLGRPLIGLLLIVFPSLVSLYTEAFVIWLFKPMFRYFKMACGYSIMH